MEEISVTGNNLRAVGHVGLGVQQVDDPLGAGLSGLHLRQDPGKGTRSTQ